MSYKEHIDFQRHKKKQFETWDKTVERNSGHLTELEESSVVILHEAVKTYPEHERFVLTSTGKDSTVIEHICNVAGYGGRTVFNNTSLDVADTYKMVKESGYEVTNPKEGFYQYIKRLNYIPTRISRGCCTHFKEGTHAQTYKDITKALWVMGVRNSESVNRSTYGFIEKNPKWVNDWYSVNPILKWDDIDVWLYILAHDLRINQKYKKGYQRVGCAIACPYYTKTTWVLDKYWYPKAYDRWHRILENDFVDSERWAKLNCTKNEYHSCWNGGLLRGEPTPEVVEEFAKFKGIDDIKIAEQYFNKQCGLCADGSAGKNIRQKDVIGMNLKMLGRDTNNFLCKKHLMKRFGWSDSKWDESVSDFKAQGCKLF